MFFSGTITEAIASSRQEAQPLIVLLSGFDQGSRQAQDALMEQEKEEHVSGCIVLALEDDLDNTDAAAFADAKNFRAFCPIDQLPTVVMVSPTGAMLAKVPGVVAAAELRQHLQAAYAAFRAAQAQAQGAPAPAAAAPTFAADDLNDLPPPPPQQSELGSSNERSVGDGAAPEPPAPAPPPPPAVDPADQHHLLQFKFTDGTSCRLDFTGASRLSEVFAALDEHRAQLASSSSSSGGGKSSSSGGGGGARLAYVLVQQHPRRVLGAADEALTLAAAGVEPGRTSLAVVPHAALGHKPPAPPAPPAAVDPPAAEAAAPEVAQATEPVPQQQQQQVADTQAAAVPLPPPSQPRRQAQKRAPPPPPPPPPPSELTLLVRLSNGDSLRRAFKPEDTLAAVLDWVDAERSDSGHYKLSQPYPKRTFYSGDLGSTLADLGFAARTALQLELLPPPSGTSRRGAAQQQQRAAPPAQPQAQPSQQPQEAEAAASAHPGDLALQFRLTDGGQLRGAFPSDSTLQEVCSYLDAHRTDGATAYTLVQPYPRRRFGPGDLSQPLAALGLQQRQLLVLEPEGGGRGGGGGGSASGGLWSLGGLLASAASYLNPYNYMQSGAAGTVGGGGPSPMEEAQVVSGSDAAAAQVATEVLPGGGDGSQGLRGARKRANVSGSSNIHTLGSGGGGGDDPADDDSNTYWNGNSTQFGGGPPPPPQQ